MRWLFAVTAIGCGSAPCSREGACVGGAVVDLSGERPAFWMEGTGDVVPDTLDVVRVESCDRGSTVWSIRRFPEPEAPIVYGEPPARAREEIEAQVLELDRDYVVTFSRAFSPSASESVDGWAAAFTWGDPDSRS